MDPSVLPYVSWLSRSLSSSAGWLSWTSVNFGSLAIRTSGGSFSIGSGSSGFCSSGGVSIVRSTEIAAGVAAGSTTAPVWRRPETTKSRTWAATEIIHQGLLRSAA